MAVRWQHAKRYHVAVAKAVILLSGGLDSATVLAMAIAQGYEGHCLTVEYGQRHRFELIAAKEVASRLGATEHRFARASLGEFGGSALTADIDVPKGGLESGIPVTYVPARNTVMLSLALAYAETIESADIFVGVNAVDYSGYPDCRPEFVAAFEGLANVATKAGVEGRRICIHAPLIAMSKSDIIAAGLTLGVDYSITTSCYDPGGAGQPCCLCDACRIRIAAFGQLGMSDPALERG